MSTIKEVFLDNKIINGIKQAVSGFGTLLSSEEIGDEENIDDPELRKAMLRADKLGDMTVENTANSFGTAIGNCELSPKAKVSEQDALNELKDQDRNERTRSK